MDHIAFYVVEEFKKCNYKINTKKPIGFVFKKINFPDTLPMTTFEFNNIFAIHRTYLREMLELRIYIFVR